MGISAVTQRSGMFRYGAFTGESKPERCCACVMQMVPNDESLSLFQVEPMSSTLVDLLSRRCAITQWNFPSDRRVNAFYVTPGATSQRLRWASARRRGSLGVLVSSSFVTLFWFRGGTFRDWRSARHSVPQAPLRTVVTDGHVAESVAST